MWCPSMGLKTNPGCLKGRKTWRDSPSVRTAWWANKRSVPPFPRSLPRPPSAPQVSANGNVLCSEIVGSIKMRVFLSGMPELRLGLNDKVLFDNTGSESSSSPPAVDANFFLFRLWEDAKAS